MPDAIAVNTVEEMEVMPKFLKDAIPADSTKREADAIKVSLIRKFGLREWQACIGRSAGKNSWKVQ